MATGKPAGAEDHGRLADLLRGLAALPENLQRSWFAFDHYYSDEAFPAALPLVFADKPKQLLDVGFGTGRWALQCCGMIRTCASPSPICRNSWSSPRATMQQAGVAHRVEFSAWTCWTNRKALPAGRAIWMSQFLVVFREADRPRSCARRRPLLGEHGASAHPGTFLDASQIKRRRSACGNRRPSTSPPSPMVAAMNRHHSSDPCCLLSGGSRVEELIEQRDHVSQFPHG